MYICSPKTTIFELHDFLSMYKIKTNKQEDILLVNDKLNSIVEFSICIIIIIQQK